MADDPRKPVPALLDADPTEVDGEERRRLGNQRRRYVRGEFQDSLDEQPEQGMPSTQEHGLEIRDLARALQTLPEPQRQVVLLVGLEGLDYKQVANVLDIPVGTVMSRLHRGREALRRLLSYDRSSRPDDRAARLRMVP